MPQQLGRALHQAHTTLERVASGEWQRDGPRNNRAATRSSYATPTRIYQHLGAQRPTWSTIKSTTVFEPISSADLLCCRPLLPKIDAKDSTRHIVPLLKSSSCQQTLFALFSTQTTTPRYPMFMRSPLVFLCALSY